VCYVINISQHEVGLNRVLKISAYVTENKFIPHYKDQSTKADQDTVAVYYEKHVGHRSKSLWAKMRVLCVLREIREGRLMLWSWQSARLLLKETGGQFRIWNLKKIDENFIFTQGQQRTSATNKILIRFYELVLNKLKTIINM
jgi:hypothetical protein